MPARMQTIDWLNAELDKTEAALAEARRQLEEAKDEIEHHCLWIETFGKELTETKQQLAASQERERIAVEALRNYADTKNWENDIRPNEAVDALNVLFPQIQTDAQDRNGRDAGIGVKPPSQASAEGKE